MWVGITSAMQGLIANKLRSLLTMLGVIFGVAAVIVAVALGQGSRDAAMRRFQRMGTRTLNVIPGRMNRGGVSFGSVTTLKMPDAAALLRTCPSILRVSPEKDGNLQVKYKDKNTNTNVMGTGTAFPKIRRSFEFSRGSYFTDQDVQSKRMVCILGYQVQQDLFGREPCVGKYVYINGQQFRVLGAFVEQGGGGWRNEDDRVYVPVTTALYRLFGTDVLGNISVEARSDNLMQRAQDEITREMRKLHKLAEGKDDDFLVFNAGAIVANSNQESEDFEQLINCLAAVALIVGGIGIMNIMLVSVTERTREIGVRKAIGARRTDILMQFMLEALFLSIIGGLIGVGVGILFTLYGLPALKPDWETTLTLAPTFLAFGISAVVGVFFGFYPALKASKLNPIEALRYE
jgi:putative ABC transport system permease protein